jgi:cyclase
LIKDGGLVKTVRFDKGKYVGDPLNAVRIFNEKEVDELIVVDIDATAENREPNLQLIGHLATECRMPLCYGGGVRSVEMLERIVQLGVEKVAFSAAAVQDPGLIGTAADRVGGQSVVVVMDVKKTGMLRRWEVFTHNGTRKTGLDPVVFARQAEDMGAGEIVLNNIDQDGEMKGYDLDLIHAVRDAVHLPLTVLGGAGSLADIEALIREIGLIGAAAGSLFVLKGVYRAVLINYPTRQDKDALLARAGFGEL